MTHYLIAALTILAFATLPGAWLLFALPFAALRGSVKLALSIALSPAILALQVLLLKAVQIPFATIPLLLLVVNAPALILIVRGWRRNEHRERPTPASWLGGGALLGLLGAYVALPWRLVPDLRTFAWHALWHTDIAYALTRNTLLPEEPELAGMRLSYSWAGHLFWSVTGWLTNLPPTVLYAVTNFIWLAVAVLLAYALCRDGLQLSRPLSIFGSGTILLGTNIVGTLGWSYARDWHWHKELLGDLRYTPMLGKYLGFETMPFAFALLIGLTLVATIALQRSIRHLWIVLTALLVALGLLYPILFPAGCLVVGLLWLLLALGQLSIFSGGTVRHSWPAYSWQALAGIALGGVVAAVITLGVLQLITVDGSNAPIHLSLRSAMFTKGVQAIVALLLFAPALLYLPGFIRRSSHNHQNQKRNGNGNGNGNRVALLLLGATVGLMLLYAVADLEALEYKYVLASTIMVAPLGAGGLAYLLRPPLVQWLGTAVTLLALVVANQFLMLRVGALIPTNLTNAPAVSESGFWIQLQGSEEAAEWIDAIRTQTPADTVVVTRETRIHVSPFLARSLYVASDFDGTAIAGYSVDNRYNLLSWRGYSADLFDQRLAQVDALTSESMAQWVAALEAMLALGRPLAIHMKGEEPLTLWLKEEALGKELYTGSDGVVWLIEPSAMTLRGLEIQREQASQ